MAKETIYIEADADIAAVIESLKNSPKNKVAFVVPKRGEILRSIVNLKLLHSIAQEMNKEISLVTTDKIIIGLASQLKIGVSANLKAPAKIPQDSPATDSKKPQDPIIIEAPFNPPRSIVRRRREKIMSKPAKKRRDPALMKRLSTWAAIVSGAGLLLVGGIWLFVNVIATPQAVIKIQTTTTSLPISLTTGLSASYQEVSLEPPQLPLSRQAINQTFEQEFPATGQEDRGQAASGSISIHNCDREGRPIRISRQTIFVASGLEFVSQSSVTLAAAPVINSRCVLQAGTFFEIDVQAAEPGTDHNIGFAEYTIKGLSGYNYTADGTEMTGGSSRLVSVVSEQDIAQAQAQLEDLLADSQAQGDLKAKMESEGLVVLDETLEVLPGQIEFDVQVGQAVEEGVASQIVTYRLGGIKETDLLILVEPALRAQADGQEIVSNGLSTASYVLTNPSGNDSLYELKILIKDAQAGLKLDPSEVFENIKGRQADEVGAELRRRTGITAVEVNLSPFWRQTIPVLSSQVEIIISNGG